METFENVDGLSELLASEAPGRGGRRGLMKKALSKSVKDLLEILTLPDMRWDIFWRYT